MPTWLIATISAVSLRRWPRPDVAGINRGTSAVTYHTSQGTYFAFHNDAGTIRAYKITADKSAHHNLRLEHESDRPRLALGHND